MQDDEAAAQEAALEVVETEAEEQAEASEATETTEGQVEDQPAEDEGKPKAEEVSRSKARRERRRAEMERLAREKADAEQRFTQTEARLRRIEEAAQKSQPPKEADFPSYEEYQAALVAHHSLRTLDDRQRREVEEEAKGQKEAVTAKERARQMELQANWQDQLSEAQSKYADFGAVFTDDLPITRETAEILADSDYGVDVAYYLGTNRKEAAQIASLSPLEQARRIGAIEARMSMPKANATSNAPEPIRPVKGKGSAQTDPTKMSIDEYRAWREAGGKF